MLNTTKHTDLSSGRSQEWQGWGVQEHPSLEQGSEGCDRDGTEGLGSVPTKAAAPAQPGGHSPLTNPQRSTETLQGEAWLKGFFRRNCLKPARGGRIPAELLQGREPEVLTETLWLCSIVLSAPGICCRSHSGLLGALYEHSAGQTPQPCPAVRALPQTRCFCGRSECPQLLIPSCCFLQSPQPLKAS